MILSNIHSLLLLQLVPAIFVAVVVVVAVVVLVINRIIMRRVRQGVELTLTAHNMMEQALKISANNTIVYDIDKQYVNKVSGHMLPDEGVNVETFKQHVHPDDLNLVVDSIMHWKGTERGVRLSLELRL